MSWVKGKPKGYRTPVIERVMARVVEADDGCWIYQGADNGVGYGIVGAGGKHGGHLYVHRVVYAHFLGEIPEGLVLDHLCRNRKCCNPEHLEPVTHRENLLRGVSPMAAFAAATECVQGHLFDEANTYRNPNTGHRSCRTCAKYYQRALRASRKESA